MNGCTIYSAFPTGEFFLLVYTLPNSLPLKLSKVVLGLVLQSPRLAVRMDFNIHAKDICDKTAQDFVTSIAAVLLAAYIKGVIYWIWCLLESGCWWSEGGGCVYLSLVMDTSLPARRQALPGMCVCNCWTHLQRLMDPNALGICQVKCLVNQSRWDEEGLPWIPLIGGNQREQGLLHDYALTLELPSYRGPPFLIFVCLLLLFKNGAYYMCVLGWLPLLLLCCCFQLILLLFLFILDGLFLIFYTSKLLWARSMTLETWGINLINIGRIWIGTNFSSRVCKVCVYCAILESAKYCMYHFMLHENICWFYNELLALYHKCLCEILCNSLHNIIAGNTNGRTSLKIVLLFLWNALALSLKQQHSITGRHISEIAGHIWIQSLVSIMVCSIRDGT